MDIEEFVDKNFSGVISVTQKGRNVFQKAFGYSDLPNKIPNRIDTKFPTASAGKVFVAVGILQLIEKGSLSFDSKIGDIMDMNFKEIDPNIKVSQLLTHTSGIPDYFDESKMDNYAELWRDYPNYKIRTSKDLVPLFINKPMMFRPGKKFLYNNTGFAVLGLIIEAITSIRFDEFLERNVFIPGGMTNTGYYELDRLPENCANAYIYDEEREAYYTNIYSVDVKGTGAGGAFTTVVDIEKFWDNLLGKKLVTGEMLEKMLSPQVKENCYGYGVWIREKEKGSYIHYFQGFDPGVSFVSSHDSEDNLLITITSNFSCNVWRLNKKIRELMGIRE